jgi:hypothetical protein
MAHIPASRYSTRLSVFTAGYNTCASGAGPFENEGEPALFRMGLMMNE